MKINSIQVKILGLVILTLIVTTFFTIYITVDSQQKNLLEVTRIDLACKTDMLNRTIRNIMVTGNAPIAVKTLASISEMEEFAAVNIYRVNGENAFNDDDTIEMVNDYLMEDRFQKTERLVETILNNDSFMKVLESKTAVKAELLDTEEMEYFFPILNTPECRSCHEAVDEKSYIRGIAHFKISIAEIYRKIREARFWLSCFFLFLGILVASIIILMLRRLIIKPILQIGDVVSHVGEGNFDVKVVIPDRNDELNQLAGKINSMIVGLKERFALSKYVSKSTDELVKGGNAGRANQRKNLTILFSDIRGFTSYSDMHDPDAVIKNLNTILEIQTPIVEKYGGDIDKFIGDELMALFENEYHAVCAAYEMIEAVYKKNNELNTDLYIGVGINTGEVTAGNIGSANRMEYAVIGDTVNLASRLCGIAKRNMILISGHTYEKVKYKIEAKMIKNQKIKGKKDLITFYAVTKVTK